MNAWTEKARAEARTRWTALAYGIQAARHAMHVFTQGARWQRHQLLGRDAVERAARVLAVHFGTTADAWPVFADEARAALAAAIEGGE